MITKESIEALKNQLDILEVISHYIEVKKMGATYKANCPFHQEKTPSFVINQSKGYYHCFGCGVSGDSITFVMEYEKLGYTEALEKLAQMYNFTLQYTKKTQSREDLRIFDFMNEFYQSKQNAKVLEYIKSRGIDSLMQEKFELGFAPSNNEILIALKEHNMNLQEALNCGILGADNENGVKRYYARLTQRLIFPIRSPQNKIIGFGGRTLDNHPAKYINSPQTKYFNKSQILYGYPQAKEQIYKKEEIIITEGYLDVIMLHQAGFTNAVATLGTALTKEHLPLISKGNPKVIIAYDGDEAGMNAAFKAAILLALAHKEGGVVIFEGGADPADMVKRGEITFLKALFNVPIPLIDYVLQSIAKKYDLSNPLKKEECLKESLDFLSQLSSVIQEEYRLKLALALKIPAHLIKVKSPKNISKIPTEAQNIPKTLVSSDDFYALSEKIIIKSVLEDSSLFHFVMDFMEASMFISQRRAFEKLLKGELEDSELIGILLDDKIKAQNKEQLKQQMIMILYHHYDEKRVLLSRDERLSLKEKSFLLRKYQHYLETLKKGDLIIYESFGTF